MKPFDFNIHLPCRGKELTDRLQDETLMNGDSFKNCFQSYKDELISNCAGGNIMLLNSNLNISEIEEIIISIKKSSSNYSVTVMLDPRDNGLRERIGQLMETGVSGIKFHSYIQELSEKDFPLCVSAALMAEEMGMLVMIDTSYGSLGMYQFDNLRLATTVASQVRKTPIVLLHSGGARCLEAMLLADAAKNIYLETSFTQPFYIGSSVERDLAYIYKKIGANRVIYGSDFPYIGLTESRDRFMDFLEHWGFSEQARASMMQENAESILELNV